MTSLALGIDTGGTFTDGVLFDLDRKEILAKSKILTTRHDLTLAIDSCLGNLLEKVGLEGQLPASGLGAAAQAIDPARIKMAALSTTLATNAIVEGRGAEVGLVMIGFNETAPELPTSHYVSIKGGCDLKGEYREDVDLAAAALAAAAMKEQVEAFAVSGYLSVRNPAQELAVAGLIRELTGCPVVCAHQLSSELGFYERTVTAVLNARLIPLITGLIAAVEKSLDRRGIHAPLMVVKGDGSLISESKARERPIETILSGPAASIIGAITLTGIKDAVVVDMGGTTTDLAVLRNGRPAINRSGARVGGWLTRVRAAAITTAGLGGDSLVHVDRKGKLSIGPQRVYPLSGIAARYPHLLRELSEIKEYEYTISETPPAMVLIYLKEPLNLQLTAAEEKILNLVKKRPHTLYHIGRQMNRDFDLLPWQGLARIGAVLPASVTPTDILHLTGAYGPWDREAARMGVKILARRYNSGITQFVDAVLEEIYFKIAALITGRLLSGREGGRINFKDQVSRFFLQEMLRPGKGERLVQFSARLGLPLVAVGAPAGAYFPEVAKRLNADLFIPSSAEVANAVGTVSGQTVERASILVRPNGDEGFIIHAPWGRETASDLEEAAAEAMRKGKEYAGAQAAAAGASDIELFVERQDRFANLRRLSDDGEESGLQHKLFIETVVEITAVGRPWS